MRWEPHVVALRRVRNSATILRTYVAQACHLVVAIVRALMGEIPKPEACAAGARALPAPIALARLPPDAPMSKRAGRAHARARTASSPVSVEAVFAVSDEQKRTLQPLTTLTLLIVYSELVRRWLPAESGARTSFVLPFYT